MKQIKLLYITLASFIFSINNGFSQDSIYIKNERINSLILKNFISYQTYRILQSQADLIETGQVKRMDFGRHLLDTHQFYAIRVKKVDSLAFKLENYKIFQLSNFNRIYTKMFDESSIKYFHNNIGMSGGNIIFKFNQSMNLGLIAYNQKEQDVIFISGPFFTEKIIKYYIKNLDDLIFSNVKTFIELQYYNYQPKDIILDRKNLCVSFYSASVKKTFKVVFKQMPDSSIIDELLNQ